MWSDFATIVWLQWTLELISINIDSGNGLDLRSNKSLPETFYQVLWRRMASTFHNMLWASYQIRKIAGCACAGNAGNVFPATAGKRSRHASRHVRDARAVMHAGIANYRFPLKSVLGENVPGIPGACATRNFTIWKEAHDGVWKIKVPDIVKNYWSSTATAWHGSVNKTLEAQLSKQEQHNSVYIL